jgi:hypothetical protein
MNKSKAQENESCAFFRFNRKRAKYQWKISLICIIIKPYSERRIGYEVVSCIRPSWFGILL